MAINKKLIHFNNKASFKEQLDAGNILDTSIVFIKETGEIYTHGKLYSCNVSKDYVDTLELTLMQSDEDLRNEAEGAFLKKTDPLISKLENIESEANKYELPTATSTTLGGVKLASDLTANIAVPETTSTAGRYYGVQKNTLDQLLVNVPWTNTTYSVVTSSSDGLVPKLPTKGIITDNGIVYPNGLVLAGDGQWKALNFSVDSDTGTMILGLYDELTGTELTSAAISTATITTSGLMSSADKAKLNSIEEGANKYALPEATNTVLGGVKLASTTRPIVPSPILGKDISRYYGVIENNLGRLVVNVPWVNTTYEEATTSTAGLMSASDKLKLNNLANNLTEVVADSSGYASKMISWNKPVLIIVLNTNEYWITGKIAFTNGTFTISTNVSNTASAGNLRIDIDDEGTISAYNCTNLLIYNL